MTAPSPSTQEMRREAVARVTPSMIDAAWDVVRDRYPSGPVLGPGPGFVEALAAGLVPVFAERDAATTRADTADRLLAEARAEIEGLRRAIQAFLDGDYESPRSHRPGQCPHGAWFYDECPSCNEAHFLAALDTTPPTAEGGRE